MGERCCGGADVRGNILSICVLWGLSLAAPETWRGARAQILSDVRRTPNQLVTSRNRLCMNVQSGIVRTEEVEVSSRKREVRKTYPRKVYGAEFVMNIHEEEDNPRLMMQALADLACRDKCKNVPAGSRGFSGGDV